MPILKDTYDSVHRDYEAAINWMSSLGIAIAQSGRIGYYEKVLRYWKDAYRTASDEEGREVFPDFVSSMFEIFEFVAVHRAFGSLPQEQLTAIVRKLEKAVNGPKNAADEAGNSAAARNFLFEACVAARVHRPASGVEAILSADSDTGIRIDRKKIWVECKRVTSVSKLEANVRDACNQLGKRFGAEVGSGHRGILAVDVTKIFNRGDKLYISQGDDELVASAERMLDEFIAQHAMLWQWIYASKHRKIIGTIFRLTFMAKSEASNLLVHNAHWGLTPRADASAADLQLLKQLVASMRENVTSTANE
ncbi:hypothetical protein [Paraburkholderia bryophila]|uniref:Restriction endonuclease n=1 Tax=Paraburkholderia bryophila TaxID=420952 RepID=A0A329C7U4_9BURK|nr:hypothetical protein [Paraburkholderia bryophila]RAS29772.1 hypothetical protein BX591_11047 [Paraburkholderia bryophila]